MSKTARQVGGGEFLNLVNRHGLTGVANLINVYYEKSDIDAKISPANVRWWRDKSLPLDKAYLLADVFGGEAIDYYRSSDDKRTILTIKDLAREVLASSNRGKTVPLFRACKGNQLVFILLNNSYSQAIEWANKELYAASK